MYEIFRQPFSSLLQQVAKSKESFPEETLTSFLLMKGTSYDRELMVIGRAVNGWRGDWEKGETNNILQEIVEETFEGVTSEGRCPMLWVTDLWGKGDKYRTSRSAYWRVIRNVVRELGVADVNHPEWPSVLAWSNLYKISPAETGNPSSPLQKVQFPFCAQMIKSEFFSLKPKRILFLTGLGWAQPFLQDLPVQWGRADGKSCVEAMGTFAYSDGERRPFVVAKHPQGKPETTWVKEVMDAFAENDCKVC